jgi:hypothetical protein
MNMQIKNFAIMATIGIFLLSSCSKEEFDESGTVFGNEDHVMTLERGYTSNVTSALEKSADYEYYTKGVIEYSKGGVVVATLDYGDGTKDVWAKLNKNGSKVDVDLSAKKKDARYKKVITSPLIKIEGCDYIVAGTIKYFKGKDWVATVDYGDGTCDEWAKKEWKGESKTFSLQK